jgi:Tol biopolymer transport system component
MRKGGVAVLSFLLAGAAVAVVALAAPSPRRPALSTSCGQIADFVSAWSPDGRAVMFTRERALGAASAVFSIGRNGERERRISAPGEYAYGGVWSRDGRRVAYSTFDDSAVVRIVVARSDGSAGKVVATFQAERNPPGTYLGWSPDSRRVSYVDQNGNLFATGADGGDTKRLLAHGATQPAWSPDGKRIAFISASSGIVVADADGENPHVIASGGFPIWSPDGQRLVYTSVSGVGVHVIGADGRGDGRLIDARGSGVQWLPNGRAVVDASKPARAHGAVRVVDLATGRIRIVSHDGARLYGSDNIQPTVSPNGKTIAFISTPTVGGSEIRLVAPSGRSERRLTYHCALVNEGTGGHISGTWLADIVLARNHLRDTISCGPGRDLVYADGRDLVGRDCETVRH